MKLKFYILFLSCLFNTNMFCLYAQNDEICNAVFLNPRCASNGYYTYHNGGATSSLQADPGCANYQGGDIWFSTIVPRSGSLVFTTQSGTVENGGMAVYRSTSCGGTLTLLNCDDDSGPDFMPQISLTGLTPGDSLFIRFWENGNDGPQGPFKIAVHDPNPAYCMVGNATQIFPGDCIQLTEENKGHLSTVWSTQQMNLASAFDYSFELNLGSNDAGADGIAFILQNNVAGTNAIGIGGSEMGIGPLLNSLMVEFDTYDNGPPDISRDHIAVNVNGDFNNPVAGPERAYVTLFNNNINIEDGNYHTVRITWDPATQRFRVYFDNLLRILYTDDLINNVFGGNPLVYWGFSGSTGFYSNDQSICPGSLPLPVEWSRFEAYIKNAEVWLEWITYTESNTHEFIIERSKDGKEFTAIGNIKASGNSTTALNYHFKDEDPLPGRSYYRLKQTDLNGDYSYSKIIVIQFANGEEAIHFELYPNPIAISKEISIDFNSIKNEVTEADFVLMNNLGQIVYTGIIYLGNNKLYFPKSISAGIYHAILKTASGNIAKKIIIQNY